MKALTFAISKLLVALIVLFAANAILSEIAHTALIHGAVAPIMIMLTGIVVSCLALCAVLLLHEALTELARFALERWRVRFLLWADYKVRDWLTQFDICHVNACGEQATRWCESCNRRHCDKHESDFYEDVDFCTDCRSEMSEQDVQQVRDEAVASNCEDSVHLKTCVCVLPHDDHKKNNCEKCICDELAGDGFTPGSLLRSGYEKKASAL